MTVVSPLWTGLAAAAKMLRYDFHLRKVSRHHTIMCVGTLTVWWSSDWNLSTLCIGYPLRTFYAEPKSPDSLTEAIRNYESVFTG